MENSHFSDLLLQLTQLPRETEWAEFKVGDCNPEDIGEYLSALANSAALHQKECAYIVWGVEDQTHKVVGTSFRPRDSRVGNEELESWLTRLLDLTVDDYPSYFDLTSQDLPHDGSAILLRLEKEKLIQSQSHDRWNLTNLGAILFAKKLSDFGSISRKAVRVIIYKGNNRITTVKEQSGSRGYASGFQGLISYVNDQLPSNEQIGTALRTEVRMYPELAVRELVANAIIHQDLNMRGDGPMVEIFSDRIEITNPGLPLIDPLRFIDEPPQSRNEILAAFMRRMNMCEERGSGIDKVVFQVEFLQLPAPKFMVKENHTKVVLFSPRKLSSMDRQDKVRACYQHACLLHVSNQRMTNATLRKRLSIQEKNYAIASRIISDSIEEKLVKPYDRKIRRRRWPAMFRSGHRFYVTAM